MLKELPRLEPHVPSVPAPVELRAVKPLPAPEPSFASTRNKPAPKAAVDTDVPPLAVPRPRHHVVAASFILCVLLPLVLSAWYLTQRAVPQYVSTAGFTVHREEGGATPALFGGLEQFSITTSTDADILHRYIHSQDLVERVEENLDLRSRYALAHDRDPVFGLRPEASIEELVAYWQRMVQISYNPGSGMLDLRVFGFDPREAQMIAEEILDHSDRLINQLSEEARADAIGHAQADLADAEARLKDAQAALSKYRSERRIIDPLQDLEAQMGLLGSLQSQLADTLIEIALLRETTRPGDPRLDQAERRIAVIRDQIDVERGKLGTANALGGESYAETVAGFERLTVEQGFAEEAYLLAASNLSAAQADARRQSRYLATYVQPTLAERPSHPRHALLLGLIALFAVLTWSIAVLIFYSLRDRR